LHQLNAKLNHKVCSTNIETAGTPAQNGAPDQPWGEIGERVRDLRIINPAMLLPSTAPIQIGVWAYRANSSRDPDPKAKNQACHH
jgi:hypothetical protein